MYLALLTFVFFRALQSSTQLDMLDPENNAPSRREPLHSPWGLTDEGRPAEPLLTVPEAEWQEQQARAAMDLQQAAASVVADLGVAPYNTLVDDRDLAKSFDFSRQTKESAKLPIAASKEAILDTVAANQVILALTLTLARWWW
jgi:hypothetical protein